MVRRRSYTIADLEVNSSFIFAPEAFLALDYAGAPTLFQLEREIENNLHTNQDLEVGCPVCGNVDLFAREINTKGRRFRCGYCFYNSESEFETVKSQKDITLAKFGLLYECQICGEAMDSYNRGTVLRHIKKHQDENKVLESEGSAEELISHSELKSLLRDLKDEDYDWQDIDWETDKPIPTDNWDIDWEAEQSIVHAVAVLQPDNSKVSGVVHFADAGSGVAISYRINGLSDGEHGFHIHEYGDLTDGCTSACAHFNPDNEVHGGLETSVRHFGDLGNIESQKSISEGEIYLPKAKLDSSKYGILGRMMIVHADRDDLGKGGDAESLKTGNAGKRLACGVIGLAEPPTHKQAESKMNLELGQQDPDDPNRMWGPDVISPIYPLKGYERPVEEVRAQLKKSLVGHEIRMYGPQTPEEAYSMKQSLDWWKTVGFSEPQPVGTFGRVTGVSDSNPNMPWVIGVWVTITKGGSPKHPVGSRVWFHVKDSDFPGSMSKGWEQGDYMAEGIRECCECSTTEGLTTIQAGTFCWDCLPINLGAEVHLLPDAPMAGWYDRHDDSVNINLANKGIRNEALEDNYSGLFDTIAHEYGHQVTSHETRSPYHSEFAAFMVQTNGDFARSKLLAVIHPMCFREIIMKLPPDSDGMISDETLDNFFSTLDFENNLDIIVQAKRFVTYSTIPEWHKDWLKHLISYVETGTSANVIFEAEEIVCPKCDWSWQRSEGGDDLFTCHKCGFDNETYHAEDDYWAGSVAKAIVNEMGDGYYFNEDLDEYDCLHFAQEMSGYLSQDEIPHEIQSIAGYGGEVTHAWVYVPSEGEYYDAWTPYGVSDWKDLGFWETLDYTPESFAAEDDYNAKNQEYVDDLLSKYPNIPVVHAKTIHDITDTDTIYRIDFPLTMYRATSSDYGTEKIGEIGYLQGTNKNYGMYFDKHFNDGEHMKEIDFATVPVRKVYGALTMGAPIRQYLPKDAGELLAIDLEGYYIISVRGDFWSRYFNKIDEHAVPAVLGDVQAEDVLMLFEPTMMSAEDNYDSTYGVKQAKIRRKLKNKIKKQAIMGTKAGQWSARKSQELKRQYEAACSKKGLKPYKGQKTKSQDNLSKWSKQGWKTASGKKSSVTGEPYFPAKAVTALKQKNLYAKAKRQKQAATKAGKQNARYSDDIRAVVKQYRAEDSECEVCRIPLSPEEKSLCNTCWESYEQSLKPEKEWWAEAQRFSAPYQPNQTLLDYSPYEMATSSVITGDFFTDSLKYGFGPESKSSENVR